MTKEQLELIIDQIIEMHRVGCEIDAQIKTCGFGIYRSPRWHIYDPRDFVEVARTLGYNTFYKECDSDGDVTWRLRHRGVEIFVLCTPDKEVPQL